MCNFVQIEVCYQDRERRCCRRDKTTQVEEAAREWHPASWTHSQPARDLASVCCPAEIQEQE